MCGGPFTRQLSKFIHGGQLFIQLSAGAVHLSVCSSVTVYSGGLLAIVHSAATFCFNIYLVMLVNLLRANMYCSHQQFAKVLIFPIFLTSAYFSFLITVIGSVICFFLPGD